MGKEGEELHDSMSAIASPVPTHLFQYILLIDHYYQEQVVSHMLSILMAIPIRFPLKLYGHSLNTLTQIQFFRIHKSVRRHKGLLIIIAATYRRIHRR